MDSEQLRVISETEEVVIQLISPPELSYTWRTSSKLNICRSAYVDSGPLLVLPFRTVNQFITLFFLVSQATGLLWRGWFLLTVAEKTQQVSPRP